MYLFPARFIWIEINDSQRGVFKCAILVEFEWSATVPEIRNAHVNHLSVNYPQHGKPLISQIIF